jgi:hypothetical protein
VERVGEKKRKKKRGKENIHRALKHGAALVKIG